MLQSPPQHVIDALKEHMDKYDRTEDDYVIFVRENGGYAFLLRTCYEKQSKRRKKLLAKDCCYIKL